MIYLTLLAALLPALGRRVCGGLWGPRIGWGTTKARIIAWGGSCALAVLPALLVTHNPWWHAVLLVPLMWIGATVPNFGAIGMGETGHSFGLDFAMLTLHGLAGVALPVIAAAAGGYASLPLLVAGMLISPCYALACAVHLTAPGLGVLGHDRAPLGELLWGGFVGIGLILAILEAHQWAL